MPWWIWLWLLVMLAVTVAGLVMDLGKPEPLWFMILEMASGLACIVFVLNYYGLLQLGRLAPLAGVTSIVLVYQAWWDVKDDPELTLAQKVLAAGLAVAIFAPAVVLGLLRP